MRNIGPKLLFLAVKLELISTISEVAHCSSCPPGELIVANNLLLQSCFEQNKYYGHVNGISLLCMPSDHVDLNTNMNTNKDCRIDNYRQ